MSSENTWTCPGIAGNSSRHALFLSTCADKLVVLWWCSLVFAFKLHVDFCSSLSYFRWGSSKPLIVQQVTKITIFPSPDRRILNSMGSPVPAEKSCTHWRSSSCSRRIARGSPITFRGCSKHGRKQTEKLHATRWTYFACFHVHHTDSIRAQLLPSHPRHRRINLDGDGHRYKLFMLIIFDDLFIFCYSRLQDETFSPYPCRSLVRPQSLPQRMVDNSIVQTTPWFPEVRLLPDTFSNWRSVDDRQSRSR